MTRTESIKKLEQIICADRESEYGTPEDNFGLIARYWTEYLKTRQDNKIRPEDVTIMMCLLKIARVQTGAFKKDSYLDLAGYALCGLEVASREQLD